MNSKIIGLRIAGTIFGIVAVLHLLRIVTGASIQISGWELPMWVNWMGLCCAFLFCIWLWLLSVSRGK